MGIIVFPGDIASEQKRAQATADGINTAVASCTGLDPALKAQWTAFYQGLTDFTSKAPGWFPWSDLPTTANAGDTMLTYERELSAWQQKLSAVCPGVVTNFQVFQPSPPIDLPPNALTFAKYLGIAAVAIAVVWGVSRVVPLIPTARMRYRERAVGRRSQQAPVAALKA